MVSSTRGTIIDFSRSLVNITFSTTIPIVRRTQGMARMISQILALRLIGIVDSRCFTSDKYRQDCAAVQSLVDISARAAMKPQGGPGDMEALSEVPESA
jgi:hypothetical protein